MRAKSKRRLGLAMVMAGLLLAAAGIGLGAYNLWDNGRAGDQAGGVMETIIQYRQEQAETPPVYQPDPVAETPVPDMPVVWIDGYDYLGALAIPALDIELPVMADWSYDRLKTAPCRYAGSVYEDDMIVCAHNYAAHFGRLKNLLAGDLVVFTDMNGGEFLYEVAEVETLAPTAIEEMESGDWELTLFTCTLGGQTRVTVRCHSLEDSDI